MQKLHFLFRSIFLCGVSIFIFSCSMADMQIKSESSEFSETADETETLEWRKLEWMMKQWEKNVQSNLWSPFAAICLRSGGCYSRTKDILESVKEEDAGSLFDAGLIYEVEAANFDEAVKHYQKAVAQNHVLAQYQLGRLYFNGLGVGEDEKEALALFQKAADKGHPYAQIHLGFLHEMGDGLPKNYSKAVEYYRQAALQGDAFGEFQLGRMYESGRGVPKDESQAVEWFLKAVEQKEKTSIWLAERSVPVRDWVGASNARYHLGKMYEEGRGVEKDDAKAAKYFEVAAQQGYTEAQYALGLMYAQGVGVEKDKTEALRWLREAAKRGHEKAQEALQELEE